MAERVRRVVRQTKARVFQGVTQLPGKLVSLFEPHTEIIRKGKAEGDECAGLTLERNIGEPQVASLDRSLFRNPRFTHTYY